MKDIVQTYMSSNIARMKSPHQSHHHHNHHHPQHTHHSRGGLSSSSFAKSSPDADNDGMEQQPMTKQQQQHHHGAKKEGVIARTPLKRRLDSAVRGFLSDVGCFVSNTSSKAVCNDISSSSSFVVLDGTTSLSLGEFGGGSAGGSNAHGTIMMEACDRWKNRMETCMSLGNVVCEENEHDVLKIYRFDTETESSHNNDHPHTYHRQASSGGDDASSSHHGNINNNNNKQTLITKAMPRVTFRKRNPEWNVNIDVNSYLPKNHIAALNHLMEHEFKQAVEKFEEIHMADKKFFGENHLIAGVSSHNLGVAHLLAGNEGRSIYYFHRAVFIKRAVLPPNDPLLAHSLIEVGNLLYSRTDYKSALSIYLEAKAVLGDTTNSVYNRDAKQQPQSSSSPSSSPPERQQQQQTEQQQPPPPSHVWPSLMSSVYNNMGCIQVDLGHLDDALLLLQRSLKYQRMEMRCSPNAERALLNISVTQSNIGHVKLRLGHYDEAMLMLEEALLVQESVLKEEEVCRSHHHTNNDNNNNGGEGNETTADNSGSTNNDDDDTTSSHHHSHVTESTSTNNNSTEPSSSITIQNTKANIYLCKRIGDVQ